MRAVALTAMAMALLAYAAPVDAQVSYAYANGAYPTPVFMGPQTNVAYGYGGVYAGQGYLNAGNFGQTYPWSSYFGPYAGYSMAGYYRSPYLGAAIRPWNGLANGGLEYLPQTPVNNRAYYSGYLRSAQYGLRRPGGGRTFGTNLPRGYEVYQPRPGGMFDR